MSNASHAAAPAVPAPSRKTPVEEEKAPMFLNVRYERSVPGNSTAMNHKTWSQAECSVNVNSCSLNVRASRSDVHEFPLGGATLHHSQVTKGFLGVRLPARKGQLLFSGSSKDVCRFFDEILAATDGRQKRAGVDKYKQLDGVASKRRRRSMFAANLRAGLSSATEASYMSELSKAVAKANAEKESKPAPKGLGRLSPEATLLLTDEQRQVCEAALQGHSIFFTGGAGTGKSFLLRQLIQMLEPIGTAITASTALAASQLGGVTLHKWAAIGRGDGSAAALARELMSKREAVQRWRCTRTLIIDEISMLDGELFGKLDLLARAVRGSNKPFGGIQIVLTGDFMQLPPVVPKGREAKFCFEVSAWSAVTRTFELTEVFRQRGDDSFTDILNQVRFGELSGDSERLLRERLVAYEGRGNLAVTRLMPLRSEVESVNARSLTMLHTESMMFTSVDIGSSDDLDRHTGARRVLELKVGALVILTRTINLRRRLVNGSQGVVVGFEGAGSLRLPRVSFDTAGEKGEGLEIAVSRETFEARCGPDMLGSRMQLPLDLAWAVSVHKSQGMTLNAVEVCLDNVFEHGQTYVALSRARRLDGVFLLGSGETLRRSVRVNPRCLAFHKGLRAAAAPVHAKASPEWQAAQAAAGAKAEPGVDGG